MVRVLRAFMWLRWRVFVNSLGRSGSRDALERISLLLDKVVPLIFSLMMVPAAIAMGVFGALAGRALALGATDSPFPLIVRIALGVAVAMALLGPLVVGSGNEASPVRMLLLPASQRTLYVAQFSSALSSPWALIVVPLLLSVPVGLAAGGALGAAVVAVIAGIVLLAAFLGLSSLSGTLLQLVMRNRRRAEALALIAIIAGPAIGLTLSNAAAGRDRRTTNSSDAPGARQERRARPVPAWVVQAQRGAALALPSEQYRTSVVAAAGGKRRAAFQSLGLLATGMLLLHAAGIPAFRWLLTSPANTGPRRATSPAYAAAAIPLVGPRVSAVALSHLRLLVRSTRGRSIVLSPLVLVLVFGVLMLRNGDQSRLAAMPIGGGLSLAVIGLTTLTLGLLQVAANQFGVDPAGCRRLLLSPLPTDDVLRGKALGTLLAGAAAGFVILAIAFAFAPGGSPALWLALPLGFIAMHLVGAPVAAMLAASLPRKANLGTLGSQGNANGLAMWLALMAYFAAALPPAALTAVAMLVLDRPMLAPVLLLAWCGLAVVIARVLFVAARFTLDQRRENLALL